MGVLTAVLAVAVVFLWYGKTAELTTFGQVVITPVFTLTGAVTGFYFGSQQGNR